MTFTTRRATLEDRAELVRLRLQLFRETGELAGDVPPPEVVEMADTYFREKLPTEQFIAWIAETEEQVIGTSGLVFFEKTSHTGKAYRSLYYEHVYNLIMAAKRGGICSTASNHQLCTNDSS